MEKREYTVYKFNELSVEAKEKAIEKWYEQEDFFGLTDDLEESCKDLLTANKVKLKEGLKIYYSLSYCQGDGLCFIGHFEYRNRDVKITHKGRYCYADSVTIDITDNDDNEAAKGVYDDFKAIYRDICKELEQNGYAAIEYRMNNEDFLEHCEANNYMFTADGEID